MNDKNIPAKADWPAAFFRDADSLVLEKLAAWFADDVDVRFANAPSIIGKAAAKEAFQQFWSTITSMSHRREEIFINGDDAAQMSVVTYGRPDGSKVAMPVASMLRRDAAGKLKRLWIYIDLTPLYAESAQ
jgi:ketosteroid isomerase-like protein